MREPSRAEPSRAEPSRAEPSRAEPSRMNNQWPFEPCPVCGEMAEVETYRSTRPGKGTFAVSQWRCPNTAKPLTPVQIILGRKPRAGTHPPVKNEKQIGDEEEMPIAPSQLLKRIKRECERANITQTKFAEKYLSFKSFSTYLSEERIKELGEAADKLQWENDAVSRAKSDQADQAPPQLTGTVLDDLIDPPPAKEADAPGTVVYEEAAPVGGFMELRKSIETLESLCDAEDLLESAVEVLRKVPAHQRGQLLDIIEQHEKLEEMQSKFRKDLAIANGPF